MYPICLYVNVSVCVFSKKGGGMCIDGEETSIIKKKKIIKKNRSVRGVYDLIS